MPIILSALVCNPQVFKPPKDVATRFGVRDTDGDNLVEITYKATAPMLIDGAQTIDGGRHAVTTVELAIERTFSVTGPQGARDLVVTARPIDANGNPTGPAQSRSCLLTLL